MGSKTAVGAEERGTQAARVLGTEPVQGSGDTLVDMAYYTDRMRKDYSSWAWAFGNTQEILDRWDRGVPGPAEWELSQESVVEPLQPSQQLLELELELEL